jgi:hypothetical protein
MHRIALAVVATILVSSFAFSQNNRSAVSLTGSDAASCAVADPCRSFTAAIAATNDGGEVIALSSAGYGPFTVNQSVSIISPAGIHAALTATSGSAITINGSGINVVLRNLWINALGAVTGIDLMAAHQLHVEGCSISNFVRAVYVETAADTYLSIEDSYIRMNNLGVYVLPTGGVTRMTVDKCRIENNAFYGFNLSPGTGTVADSIIRESLVTSNSEGLYFSPSALGMGSTNVEGCAFVHNADTALTGGGANKIIRVSQSYIANNGTGLSSSGGDDLRSFGNNRLAGNGTDGAFTSTIALK